jgi:hypothetical protein
MVLRQALGLTRIRNKQVPGTTDSSVESGGADVPGVWH